MVNVDKANTLILVFCGLPGAGKSTVANSIASQAELHGVAVHQFCLDELHLRNSCGIAGPPAKDDKQTAGQSQQPADKPGFDPGTWQATRQLLLQQVQQQLTRIKHQQQQQQQNHQVAASVQNQVVSPQQQQSELCQQQPVVLLVDDLNHLRSMRYEFVQLARTYDAAFLQIHVTCPVDICSIRNRQRAGPAKLPEDIMHRLANNFEAPDPNKAQWEAGGRTFTVDSTTQPDTAQLWQSIQQRWGSAPPAPPSEDEMSHRRMAGSAANAASLVHQFDMETRSMLTRTLAAVSKDSCASVAQHLNQHRKQLLEQLRGCQHVQHHRQNHVALSGADGSNMENSDPVASTAHHIQKELLQRFQQLCDSVVAQHFRGT